MKYHLKKKGWSVPERAARGPDERFHVVEVPRELPSAQGSQPVLRPRPPAFEALGAGDVLGILELAAMDGKVAVGRLEERLELVERERVGRRERAHDAQAQPVMNHALGREIGRASCRERV